MRLFLTPLSVLLLAVLVLAHPNPKSNGALSISGTKITNGTIESRSNPCGLLKWGRKASVYHPGVCSPTIPFLMENGDHGSNDEKVLAGAVGMGIPATFQGSLRGNGSSTSSMKGPLNEHAPPDYHLLEIGLFTRTRAGLATVMGTLFSVSTCGRRRWRVVSLTRS
ncbi:hypothetical protein F5148DRAFT_1150850 [Russula earlei]|uniref:Uncharacterized protein n=1 Tax=Russula earlei TaxID=71964 RepID=A0ACC0U3E9_9AGAM|nr:hypothetical protein F5148DRAFT_1150850 [Russula earlei]